MAFIDPSEQNQLYHTPLLSKISDLSDRQKMVNNPFKSDRGQHFQFLQCFYKDLNHQPGGGQISIVVLVPRGVCTLQQCLISIP